MHLRKTGTIPATVAALGAVSAAGYCALPALERAMFAVHATHRYILGATYGATVLGLFVAYGGVAILAWRGRLDRGASRAVSLILPLAFMVALTFARPVLSIDVLTYIAQGRQVAAGNNPYAQPLRDLAQTPLGDELAREGWMPVHGRSPYGALWTQFEAAVVRATASIRGQMVMFKVTATAFALGSAWLIWTILGATAPGTQMLGVVLFLWNPTVVAELGGEGHNDAVMIFFVLLSLYLSLAKRDGWGVAAIGVGALVKITALLVAPLQMVHAWRTHDRGRLVFGVVAGAAAALVVGAAAYARFWIGAATFDGLRAHGHPSVLASTPGALLLLLTHWYPEDVAARMLSISLGTVFLGCLGAAALTVEDRRSLLRACGWVAVAYFVLAPGYWPWYACLPIALLALSPSPATIYAIVVVSLGARLSAPIDMLRVTGLMSWRWEVFLTTMVGVWFPAAAIAAWVVWLRRKGVQRADVRAVRRSGSRPVRVGPTSPRNVL